MHPRMREVPYLEQERRIMGIIMLIILILLLIGARYPASSEVTAGVAPPSLEVISSLVRS
jgi:hypothetical protein